MGKYANPRRGMLKGGDEWVEVSLKGINGDDYTCGGCGAYGE